MGLFRSLRALKGVRTLLGIAQNGLSDEFAGFRNVLWLPSDDRNSGCLERQVFVVVALFLFPVAVSVSVVFHACDYAKALVAYRKVDAFLADLGSPCTVLWVVLGVVYSNDFFKVYLRHYVVVGQCIFQFVEHRLFAVVQQFGLLFVRWFGVVLYVFSFVRGGLGWFGAGLFQFAFHQFGEGNCGRYGERDQYQFHRLLSPV